MTCSVKICGITSAADALMASEAGADYLGILVQVRQSPRSVTLETASSIIAAATIPVIVLTYDHTPHEVLMIEAALHPAGLQLAGNEDSASIAAIRGKVRGQLWKSLHLPLKARDPRAPQALAEEIRNLTAAGIDKIVLDTALKRGSITYRGGTGERCDWSLAATIKEQVTEFIFLAGGINPQNVHEALLSVRPDGIDASSGVESAVGKKDPFLLRGLIQAVRSVQPSASGIRGQ